MSSRPYSKARFLSVVMTLAALTFMMGSDMAFAGNNKGGRSRPGSESCKGSLGDDSVSPGSREGDRTGGQIDRDGAGSSGGRSSRRGTHEGGGRSGSIRGYDDSQSGGDSSRLETYETGGEGGRGSDF